MLPPFLIAADVAGENDEEEDRHEQEKSVLSPSNERERKYFFEKDHQKTPIVL
jgi:hypothetical protein